LGLPLTTLKDKIKMVMYFGLRPISSVGYSIQERKKIRDIDSVTYLYEGNGGLNEAFVGVGKDWGGFRIGINTGYRFGRKETTTRTFITDTVAIPAYSGNNSTNTAFGNVFLSGGMQYNGSLNKNTKIRLGATATLQQKLNGKQDITRETFYYNTTGTPTSFDSVYKQTDVAGTIQTPSTFAAGITIVNTVGDKGAFERGSFGVEYEVTNWSNYRFYGQKDNVANAWLMKIGGQYTPNPLPTTNYWDHVTYRLGFNFGKDAVMTGNDQYGVFNIAIGAGLPIRKWRAVDNQFTNINTAIEFGKRGTGNNNITESYFRFTVGLSLSDIWFQKRRYD